MPWRVATSVLDSTPNRAAGVAGVTGGDRGPLVRPPPRRPHPARPPPRHPSGMASDGGSGAGEPAAAGAGAGGPAPADGEGPINVPRPSTDAGEQAWATYMGKLVLAALLIQGGVYRDLRGLEPLTSEEVNALRAILEDADSGAASLSKIRLCLVYSNFIVFFYDGKPVAALLANGMSAEPWTAAPGGYKKTSWYMGLMRAFSLDNFAKVPAFAYNGVVHGGGEGEGPRIWGEYGPLTGLAATVNTNMYRRENDYGGVNTQCREAHPLSEMCRLIHELKKEGAEAFMLDDGDAGEILRRLKAAAVGGGWPPALSALIAHTCMHTQRRRLAGEERWRFFDEAHGAGLVLLDGNVTWEAVKAKFFKCIEKGLGVVRFPGDESYRRIDSVVSKLSTVSNQYGVRSAEGPPPASASNEEVFERLGAQYDPPRRRIRRGPIFPSP